MSEQKIILGECLEEMKKMEDNSIDCIITDPPYGVSFMGKGWDKGIPSHDYWKEMLRITKPGGHLLAAGLPRMMHRLISFIEDSGWEVRDLIMHLFGSGFPKSHNNFGLKGYGTALKPAWEGWSLCMKPIEGTFKNNAERWGVAGINIDDSRIGVEERINNPAANKDKEKWRMNNGGKSKKCIGRWPANIILDEAAAEILDQQSNASRFFYCAKASSSERNAGLEGMPLKECGVKNASGRGFSESDPYKEIKRKNNHPTVKPISLMEYLIKLIMPPSPTAILLDPFLGSGTTLIAAKQLGINAVGIEKNSEYAEIAKRRIDNAKYKNKQMDLIASNDL